MRQKTFSWDKIVECIKRDAEEMDYVVDFLDKKLELTGIAMKPSHVPCYVYYKDDDQSAIYELNDQHRAQLEDKLSANNDFITLPEVFWSELNEHYRMTT